MHPLVRALLEREQLVGTEVALVVAPAPAREDRRVYVLGLLVLLGGRRHGRTLAPLRTGEDLHGQFGERNAALIGYEPRVLHVEARRSVLRDRVRVHRE